MSVLPKAKVARIEFCEQHNTPWSTNAVAIGTTTTAVTDLATKAAAARDAFNAQQEAQNAAKSATNTFNMAVEAMTAAAAEIIKQIKTKAGIDGNGVYSLADIPVPATPSPMGELGTPHSFKAELGVTGELALTWKNTNPVGASGVVYQIWRRATPTGEFEYLGGVGEKKFVDATIPAGSSEVAYQVQAVRSTSVGPFAEFSVRFGAAGSTTTTVTEAQPKLAA
jgi:hypothetical protein